MPETVISVEQLSKSYRLGAIGGGTLRADVSRWLAKLQGKADPNLKIGQEQQARLNGQEFWALQDVSFEVKQGEILGVIGRNGAGKSTLLKILSRVTAPSSGAVRVKGRIASLLEVGTGFHPELTGRENIFLNGAILGMSKTEIRKKFDEIVDFSGVEEFIDTPVKRYSSGMYVRLAFAVAAHLEPEILIVDEVLAVGDMDFQKKCLGKMQDVSKQEGRTILFVSHNMEAVLKLCTRAVLMESGKIRKQGAVVGISDLYLKGHLTSSRIVDLRAIRRTVQVASKARLVSATTFDGRPGWSFPFGEGLTFDLEVESQKPIENIEVGIGLFSSRGFEVASWTSTYAGTTLPLKTGSNKIRLDYREFKLLPGQYYLGIGIRSERGFEDYIPEAIRFEILVSKVSSDANTNTFGGLMVPNVNASVVNGN